MSKDKKIEIETKNVIFGDSPFIKEVQTVEFDVKCYNEKTETDKIRCALLSDHRKVNILKEVNFPFYNFNLQGYTTNANLEISEGRIDVANDLGSTAPINITETYGDEAGDVLTDEQKTITSASHDPTITINFQGTALWNFINNTLVSNSISGSFISDTDYLEMDLPAETCQKIQIIDHISTVEISYSASSEFRMYVDDTLLSNNETIHNLRPIFNLNNFDILDNKVITQVNDKLYVRFLRSKYGTFTPIACPNIDQSPILDPVISYLGQNRYAISINPNNGYFYLDNLAISETKWQSIADYSNKKVYADLVTNDNCFQMWLIIPAPFCWCCLPFCFPLLLPFWLDVKIFNLGLWILSKIIQALADNLIVQIEMLREQILHNLSIQNLVKLGKKASGITKALVNGDLNDNLLDVLQNLVRIGKELYDTFKDTDRLKKIIEDIAKVLLKIGQVLLDIQDFMNPANIVNKIKISSLELIQSTLETFKSIIVSILDVVKDIITLIQGLPDNIATRHFKKIVNAIDNLAKTIIKFAQDIENYAKTLISKIDVLSLPNKLDELGVINKIILLSNNIKDMMEELVGSISSLNVNIDLSIFDELIEESGERILSGDIDLSFFIDKFKDVLTNFMTEETLEEVKATISKDGVDEDALKGIIFSKLVTPFIGDEISGYIQDFMQEGIISDERLDALLTKFMGPYFDEEIIQNTRVLIKEYLSYETINKESFSYLMQYFLGDYLDAKVINHIKTFVFEDTVNLPVLTYDSLNKILKAQDSSSKFVFKQETDAFFGVLEAFNPEPLIEEIKGYLSIRTAQMEFLNTILEDTGAKQLALVALQKAENQTQSDIEKAIEAKALEVAASADEFLEQGVKVLKLKEIEALLFENIYKIRELIDKLLDMVQDFLGDRPEQEKRRVVSNLIKEILDRDIYHISRFGRFDPNNPTETQIIINDINGVKIISKTGDVLWHNTRLCNVPFVEFTKSLSSHGCDSPYSLRGITPSQCADRWNCKGKEFWFDYIKRKVSFDFMNNHNLALGGIRIGDFDGDGIDDVWCYAPKTTKGASTSVNKVVFSPLDKNYNLTLSYPSWCQDGNIVIGDFNGDKKDDSLCLMSSGFSLLYGDVATFNTVLNTGSGILPLGTLTEGWDHTKKIIVADIDGDHFADLVKIEHDTINILFGHKDKHFVIRPEIVQKFIQLQDPENIKKCQNSDINKIIVGDLNNDKRSDIVCIPNDSDTQPVVLYAPDFSDPVKLSKVDVNRDGYESSISNATSGILTNPKKKAAIIIEDIKFTNLFNLDISTSLERKYKNINNIYPGDQNLISYYESDNVIKTISDIGYNFDCFNTVDYNLDVSIVLKDSLEIPENLISPGSNASSIRTISFEVSAQWSNNKLINLYSSHLTNFGNFVDSANGLSYNTSIIRVIKSINLKYEAQAKIYIEEGDQILVGQELRDHAKAFLYKNEVNDDESSVSVPISGQITLNMLDLGYHEIIEEN